MPGAHRLLEEVPMRDVLGGPNAENSHTAGFHMLTSGPHTLFNTYRVHEIDSAGPRKILSEPYSTQD